MGCFRKGPVGINLVEGYRAGGADEPIVVLGTESEQEMAVFCYEVGADGYVCVNTATTRNLIWVVVRGSSCAARSISALRPYSPRLVSFIASKLYQSYRI